MVSADDIIALRRLKADSDRVLSLYLELDPSGAHAQACRVMLSAALLEDPRLKAFAGELEKIAGIAASARGGRHAGLAVFASPADGLLKAVPLPQPARPGLRLASAPYLVPLENMLEHYQRYGIVLLSPTGARFLEVFLGEAEEHTGLAFPPAGPGEGAAALHRRLAAVSRRALELVRTRSLERVLLGAPPELENDLLRHLHGRIQDSLIVDPGLAAGSSPDEVVERVLLGERESRKVRENVLVYRLLDAARDEAEGVVGLAPTLSALREGRVRLLLVRQGLARMGRVCRHCGALSVAGKKCPYCWLDTEATVNLVSDMVGLALDQGCEVVQVLDDPRLDAGGGVGAELSSPPEVKDPPKEPPKDLPEAASQAAQAPAN